MPRGVPKAGFRMTKNRLIKNKMNVMLAPSKPVKVQSVAEIEANLADRFEALEVMAEATARGLNRSLIVSGPAGLGKSFTVEEKLEALEHQGYHVTYIKGYVRPLALYRLLYNSRNERSVLVFDDSDSVFSDDVSMNLLKGACDSTERRILHWLSESVGRLQDEEGESVPEKFEFLGSVIFITNCDFDDMIARGSKLAPHFQALISRSHYLDLEMKSTMDYVVRIKQVVNKGMLTKRGLNKNEEILILDFIETNVDRLRELSLRMVVKLAGLMKMDNKNWQKLAKQTCFKSGV